VPAFLIYLSNVEITFELLFYDGCL
jgi:hypothetical protein